MDEVWKDVVGYEGLYQVSNKGRVKSLERTVQNNSGLQLLDERIMKYYYSPRGYVFLILRKDNKSSNKYIHRLVAEAFIGNTDLQVNHINGIKQDNSLENLEFVSNRENNSHRYHKEGHLTGAHFNKTANKWQSAIKINKKNISLGYFDSQEEAHNAYKKACIDYNVTNKYMTSYAR